MLRASIILLLVASAVAGYAGIDLTPSIVEYTNSGAKIQQLIFKYNDRQIEYEPPARWRFHGEAKQLRLDPPEKEFAEVAIEAIPLQKPQPLDEKTVKLCAEQFLASVPPGSQSAKVDEIVPNPVLLDGNPSVQITMSFQAMGQKFVRTAIVAHLKDTRLVFRLTALEDDFEPLFRAFKTSILSWHTRAPK